MAKRRDAYPWERAADLLGVAVGQVQSWIVAGQLKVLDTSVTDRSFEEFFKKHGAEINTALIDPATAKWLIERCLRLQVQSPRHPPPRRLPESRRKAYYLMSIDEHRVAIFRG
jgi:hypothetical protein